MKFFDFAARLFVAFTWLIMAIIAAVVSLLTWPLWYERKE